MPATKPSKPPTPAPLSRRRQRTRDELLDAAARVVSEVGIAGASVDTIAQAAGVTAGAVYSNFQGKDELLVALVERMADALDDVALEGTHGRTLREALGGIGAAMARAVDERGDVIRLWAELQSKALRDPAMRERLAGRITERRTEQAGVLQELADGFDEGELALPTLDAMLVLSAMHFGLSQARLVLGPDVISDDLYAKAFALLADDS